MTTEEIESNLWEMANNLRGTMDASEYKNYILAYMFYRYLSQREEKYLIDQQLVAVKPSDVEDAFPETFKLAVAEEGNGDEVAGWKDFEEDLISSLGYAIKPQFMWKKVVKDVNEGTAKASDFQDMIDQFDVSVKKNVNSEGDFNGIFSDVHLGDSRLGSSTADRAKSIGGIIDLVDKTSYIGENGEDILGEIYEYLIKQFAASAGKKGGEFYTPHEVSQLIAKIVTYGKKVTDQSFSVFDPTCGSGSLLLTVGSFLDGADKKGAIKYYGQEINTST